MHNIDRETLKMWAIEIVGQVSPDDVFVVEDGIDALVEDWYKATAQDEGRFVGGIDVSAFAAIVVPFLLGFFGDAVKDIVKDAAKKAVGTLLDKLLKRKASPEETVKLKTEIDAAIIRSRFSDAEKDILRNGFNKLLVKLSSPS